MPSMTSAPISVPTSCARSITGRMRRGSSDSAAPYSDARSPSALKPSKWRSMRSPTPLAASSAVTTSVSHAPAAAMSETDTAGLASLTISRSPAAALRNSVRRSEPGGSAVAAGCRESSRATAALPAVRCSDTTTCSGSGGREGSVRASSRSISGRRTPRAAMRRT